MTKKLKDSMDALLKSADKAKQRELQEWLSNKKNKANIEEHFENLNRANDE